LYILSKIVKMIVHILWLNYAPEKTIEKDQDKVG